MLGTGTTLTLLFLGVSTLVGLGLIGKEDSNVTILPSLQLQTSSPDLP
jgi:hypothetical protein